MSRRRSLPTWAILLIVAAPVIAIVAVASILLAAYTWKTAAKAEQGGPAAAAAAPSLDATGAYNPADLRRFLIGKPEADALRFFGAPLRTQTAGGLTLRIFTCATRDPETGRKDQLVIVTIVQGKIHDVGCGDADKPAPKKS